MTWQAISATAVPPLALRRRLSCAVDIRGFGAHRQVLARGGQRHRGAARAGHHPEKASAHHTDLSFDILKT
jgi:prolyl-tRNA editing enzyme YbaK/EbsC (Cys-tRNA(Pro) deacylase)